MSTSLRALAVSSLLLATSLSAAPPPSSPAPAPAPATALPVASGAVRVDAANPIAAARAVETISLRFGDLLRVAPALEPAKAAVTDGAGKAVESQLVDQDGDGKPDEIVFQAAFAASEKRSFVIRAGERRPAPASAYRVYGRFVRERHDDFAWENDRIAHRMYGPDLENWKAEPLTSSGVDVWCKRVRKLVVNEWYQTDDYHRDNGEGADLYSVGKSRGCGGSGIWAGGKLTTSRNFVNSRVIANGPIRLIFELEYAPWDAAGRRVSETKRVTLDAGKTFDRFDSTYMLEGAVKATAADAGALLVGAGIAKHAGSTFLFDRKAGWLRSWEPLKSKTGPEGNLGCAIVAAPAAVTDNKVTDTDQLLILDGRAGGNAYYAGFGWDRSGDVADAADFGKIVDTFAREVAAPIRVTLAAAPAAPSPAPGHPGVQAAAGGAPPPATAPSTWAARLCDQLIARQPVLTEKWTYDAGLVLKGCADLALATNDRRVLDYVKANLDRLIDADGKIQGYRLEDYNLDNINMGKVLFTLLADLARADAGAGASSGGGEQDRDRERYRRALATLRSQLRLQPRTADGAFWHKLIYPRQMWLDGVYMASPFLAEASRVLNEPALIDEAANQVLLAEKHMRDPKTGLLYHGWDETRTERWVNPRNDSRPGTSPSFWGRAMGWYAMAVVDVLAQMPKTHPKREQALAVLRRLAAAIASVQDKASGVWWQVLDAPGRGKNYEEASASAMFVYALGKGVKEGWLDGKKYGAVAARGFDGIVARFVETAPDGRIDVKGICRVAGLGGTPYRDGSFDYYTGTEVAVNDPKGVGAFILASVLQGK